VQASHAPGSLRLLSFNIQAGTSTARYRHYFTRGWRQVLPHGGRVRNLDAIADLVSAYDLVALQEVDSGSLRSGFINQTKYLANHSDFPYWTHQSNRKVGAVAYAGNGLLTRVEPDEILNYRLPGPLSARGALAARYGQGSDSLVVVSLHLALAPRARQAQLNFIAKRLKNIRHKIILGDLNTSISNAAMGRFVRELELETPTRDLLTYPSWQPQRSIDHILVSRELKVLASDVPALDVSDHCPVSLEVQLPPALNELFFHRAAAMAG
jgi:endonuclease/exonuclease/phosphatase family metal-dependent hydrolase